MDQKKVWDEISEPWKNFRSKPIPEVMEFLDGKKGNILDLGCGGGRNFKKINGIIYGVDFSEKQLEFAKEYADKKNIKVKLTQSSADKLPFKNNFFDAAICINVIHCINSKEKRENSLKELFRTLKPKAQTIISVWDRSQKRLKNKPKICYIPWTVNGKKYQRYTYIYDKEELIELLKKVGFKIIEIENKSLNKEEGLYKTKNIIFLVEKP